MKIISNKHKLTKLIKNEKSLGFVPTMGALHKGHISLIQKSISQNQKTVVSIFINKPQFNRKNDFINYPRVLKKDVLILKKLRVNYLYIPTDRQIYPAGQNKKIKINSFGKMLCGKFRPRHFESVVDVIDRFIKIIKPNRIYLGKKDMQQLKLIEDFLNENHSKTKVIPGKTIREKNGLACSSRNFLLTNQEKNVASKVYKYLVSNKKKIIKNKLYLKEIRKYILKLGVKRIDYLELLNINKVIKPYKKKNIYKIFIAYYLRSTRLIDNI